MVQTYCGTPTNFSVCCICSSTIVKRKKLGDHGEKCIFIGYSEESKAYKLHNLLTKKLMISRDVVFNEEEAWNLSKEETTQEQNVWMNLMSPIRGSITSYTTISSICYIIFCKRLPIFWGRY